MTAKQSVSDIALFSSLSPSAQESLNSALIWRKYRSGDEIIGPESDNRDVFFITEGRARIVLHSVSGREVALDDVEAGGYFGELSAIDGEPRSACVMAIEDSIVASLSADSFRMASTENPEVAFAVMQRLANIVRTASARILDLSTLGANNRVHGEVLRLSKLADLDDYGHPMIKPIPVHSDLASRVSTTRETVARVMGDLYRQGLVRREKDHLLVMDIERLEAIVDEVRG